MIKDSGNRTEFESGAVRDIQEGKGRCDLLPLDVIFELYPSGNAKDIIWNICSFLKEKQTKYLLQAMASFCFLKDWTREEMILEVSIHFEEGAKKYGDRNWEKGIPISRYVDSGLRHLFKYLRGDVDERHDRAFCWNMLCAMWTCNHKPDLIDI